MLPVTPEPWKVTESLRRGSGHRYPHLFKIQVTGESFDIPVMLVRHLRATVTSRSYTPVLIAASYYYCYQTQTRLSASARQ